MEVVLQLFSFYSSPHGVPQGDIAKFDWGLFIYE